MNTWQRNWSDGCSSNGFLGSFYLSVNLGQLVAWPLLFSLKPCGTADSARNSKTGHRVGDATVFKDRNSSSRVSYRPTRANIQQNGAGEGKKNKQATPLF